MGFQSTDYDMITGLASGPSCFSGMEIIRILSQLKTSKAPCLMLKTWLETACCLQGVRGPLDVLSRSEAQRFSNSEFWDKEHQISLFGTQLMVSDLMVEREAKLLTLCTRWGDSQNMLHPRSFSLRRGGGGCFLNQLCHRPA